MKNTMYYKDKEIDDMVFPDATDRPVMQGRRNPTLIPNAKAISDRTNNRVFAIVSDGYKIVRHEEVIKSMDELCAEFPEYGTPTREVWMSNHGGRMKTRWTFTDVDFEIGLLADGNPDLVHPTLETFCSYDTSLAHLTSVGGFRVICSNGLIVGKILGKYKRKHTKNIDLERAKMVLASGMNNYSEATKLWLSYANRNALLNEINCYEEIGFNKDERASIETSIKNKGNVIAWDDEEPKNRKVEINAWELYNIYTAESSHRIKDVTRQTKVNNKIASTFA